MSAGIIEPQDDVSAGSPTPLSDYLAKHGLSIHRVAKKLRLHENTVKAHAYGLKAPTLGAGFLYQEELGIDIRHWERVPAVAAAKEECRRDPDTLPKKQRDYMRRRYHADQEFNERVKGHGKKKQLRLIQMVKEGKAYYSKSPNGWPVIKVKDEFKRTRWPAHE